MNNLINTLLAFMTAILIGLYRAWAVWVLWGWFGQPHFPSLNPSYLEFVGLLLTIAAVRSRWTYAPKEEHMSVLKHAVLAPITLVIVGFTLKMFM